MYINKNNIVIEPYLVNRGGLDIPVSILYYWLTKNQVRIRIWAPILF